MAQFGSASALGAEGRGFKSLYPEIFALIAQWIEHRPSKPRVVGSNPTKRVLIWWM